MLDSNQTEVRLKFPCSGTLRVLSSSVLSIYPVRANDDILLYIDVERPFNISFFKAEPDLATVNIK